MAAVHTASQCHEEAVDTGEEHQDGHQAFVRMGSMASHGVDSGDGLMVAGASSIISLTVKHRGSYSCVQRFINSSEMGDEDDAEHASWLLNFSQFWKLQQPLVAGNQWAVNVTSQSVWLLALHCSPDFSTSAS